MTANFKEGARRIKIVGQLTALAGAIIMALFFILPSYRTFIAYLFVSLYLSSCPSLRVQHYGPSVGFWKALLARNEILIRIRSA